MGVSSVQLKSHFFRFEGSVPDSLDLLPNWTIEMLLPKQCPNKVSDSILHCLEHGRSLGLFVDSDELSILSLRSQQQLVLAQKRLSLTSLAPISPPPKQPVKIRIEPRN